MSTENRTEADASAALAVAAAGVLHATSASSPFVLLPEGYQCHDLSKTQPYPHRARGVVEARDVSSFISVASELATPSTRVYRTVEPPRFVAVLNDTTTDGGPGWGDHQVVYDCPLSIEWRAWAGQNKKVMSQAEFAQFIEDNLPDIVAPTAAEMLEVSRTLQAKKKVNFASAIRLENGQNQFTYEETVSGSAGAKGQLSVPEVFTIGVAVFEGGDAYAVRARLRYRIADGGGLTMWYDLERPHKVIEDAVKSLQAQVEKAMCVTTVNGSRRG